MYDPRQFDAVRRPVTEAETLPPTMGALLDQAVERFGGREALVAQKAAGASRVAWGVKATGRGVPRSHMDVKDAAGSVVGHTTSGTFSPTLQIGIALALLDPSVKAGDEVLIDVRGRGLAAEVVRPPFVAPSTS